MHKVQFVFFLGITDNFSGQAFDVCVCLCVSAGRDVCVCVCV